MTNFIWEDRVKLQYQIDESLVFSLTELADKLGYDSSSVYREIKRSLSEKKILTHTKIMETKRKTGCERTKRFPYCCNGCQQSYCKNVHLIYDAYDAQFRAERSRSQPRKKMYLNHDLIEELNEKIAPYVRKGISVEVALNETNLKLSASTIRRYINQNLLEIRRLDLLRAVKFKVNMEYVKKDKRVNVRVLYQRMWRDYLQYMKTGKYHDVEIDTVIGKLTDEYCLLTIYEPRSKLQIGLKIKKTSAAVNQAISKLLKLCELSHTHLFDVILTDNGSEFQSLPDIEYDKDTGVLKFKTFYCDPYRSNQKGRCERNHEFFRYFVSKGISLDQGSNSDFELMFSHINSYPRKSLGFKSPYQVFKQRYGDDLLRLLNIQEIPVDQINFKLFK